MIDPTTPEDMLQPVQSQYASTPEDGFSAPDADSAGEDTNPEPAAPQEAPEPPQQEAERPAPPERPKKIGKTVADQLHDRTRVMLDRLDSFERLLHELGVVDPEENKPGVRGIYIEALGIVEDLRPMMEKLHSRTNEVKNTFDNL